MIRAAYRGIVSDDFLFGKLTVLARIENIRKAIESNSDRFDVCESEGIVVGFTRSGPSRDDDLPGVPELYAIYIDPCFQRSGFGRRLMEHFLNSGIATTPIEAALWVFKGNDASRRFYERMGFVPDGKEKVYAELAPALRYVRHRP